MVRNVNAFTDHRPMLPGSLCRPACLHRYCFTAFRLFTGARLVCLADLTTTSVVSYGWNIGFDLILMHSLSCTGVGAGIVGGVFFVVCAAAKNGAARMINVIADFIVTLF